MNEGTRSGKSTIRLLGISAERPTNGLYLFYLLSRKNQLCFDGPCFLQQQIVFDYILPIYL
jgi:hypothetical protein